MDCCCCCPSNSQTYYCNCGSSCCCDYDPPQFPVHEVKKKRKKKIRWGKTDTFICDDEETSMSSFECKCQICPRERTEQESVPPSSSPEEDETERTSNNKAVNYQSDYDDNYMVQWVNRQLRYNYGKIEELNSGTAYCQLMDMLFPGSLSLKNVKFETTVEHERVRNFQILQDAFQKVRVHKLVPIDKLVSGDRAANLRLLEWFHSYLGNNFNPPRNFGGCQIPFCGGAGSMLGQCAQIRNTHFQCNYNCTMNDYCQPYCHQQEWFY